MVGIVAVTAANFTRVLPLVFVVDVKNIVTLQLHDGFPLAVVGVIIEVLQPNMQL